MISMTAIIVNGKTYYATVNEFFTDNQIILIREYYDKYVTGQQKNLFCLLLMDTQKDQAWMKTFVNRYVDEQGQFEESNLVMFVENELDPMDWAKIAAELYSMEYAYSNLYKLYLSKVQQFRAFVEDEFVNGGYKFPEEERKSVTEINVDNTTDSVGEDPYVEFGEDEDAW